MAVFFTLYLRLVGWSTRFRYIGEENLPKKPYIYVFWHCHILLVSYTHRGRAVRVLASTSEDGDVSARSNRQFGHRIIRGTASSTKEGAKTAIKIIRCLKQGNVVAITPDGPKGPRLKAKRGVSFIARKTNCPVVPVAWSAKRKKILNTWDKTILPLPFNKIVVVSGVPVYVNKEDELESSAKKIEDVLNEIKARADRLAGEL